MAFCPSKLNEEEKHDFYPETYTQGEVRILQKNHEIFRAQKMFWKSDIVYRHHTT